MREDQADICHAADRFEALMLFFERHFAGVINQ